MNLQEFKKLPENEQWETAGDYMRDWNGEASDTPYLIDEVREGKGHLLEEFGEYLNDQN